MIGQSNRQTFPQRASLYFQRFMLPQSANVASLCGNFESLGYSLGYSRGGLRLLQELWGQQDCHGGHGHSVPERRRAQVMVAQLCDSTWG